jgi:nucleoside-diphosphate-sugar epimerase
MQVLVMGGTRFNGLALVHELARHGHDVTIFNRGQTEARLPGGVRRLLGDRTDHAAMREAFAGEEFDCVYDISAYTPADVESMIEIFAGRIGHYVFASSTVTYAATKILPITEDFPVDASERQSQYGLDKIACEAILRRAHRQHGFPATIVPFSMVFGPNNIIPEREQRMFSRLLLERPVLIPGDGTTLSQIGHVDDEARALRMLMLRPQTFGKRYNLTGRDYWTDEGYVDTFAEVVGVEPRKVFVPPETMDAIYDGELSLAVGEVGSLGNIRTASEGRTTAAANLAYLQQLIQRLAPYIHRWNNSAVFSVDRLRRDAGWEPDYTFRAAVEQTYEWYRSEGLFEARHFDFRWEDALLEQLRAS